MTQTQQLEPTPERLAQYIRLHGFEAETQGRLIRANSPVRRDDGTWTMEYAFILPTFQHVREWLGY